MAAHSSYRVPGGSRTTRRGYNGDHRKAREEALRELRDGEDCCPFCHEPMFAGQSLDFDHELPVAMGGKAGPRRLSHASCNRSAGARLGNRMRGRGTVVSRGWTATDPYISVPVEEL